jgi:excisionase family DNA binding protein
MTRTNAAHADVTRLLTVKETATYTGYTAGYIRQLIAEGKVQAIKRGPAWFVSPAEAERLKQQRAENQ